VRCRAVFVPGLGAPLYFGGVPPELFSVNAAGMKITAYTPPGVAGRCRSR